MNAEEQDIADSVKRCTLSIPPLGSKRATNNELTHRADRHGLHQFLEEVGSRNACVSVRLTDDDETGEAVESAANVAQVGHIFGLDHFAKR